MLVSTGFNAGQYNFSLVGTKFMRTRYWLSHQFNICYSGLVATNTGSSIKCVTTPNTSYTKNIFYSDKSFFFVHYFQHLDISIKKSLAHICNVRAIVNCYTITFYLKSILYYSKVCKNILCKMLCNNDYIVCRYNIHTYISKHCSLFTIS